MRDQKIRLTQDDEWHVDPRWSPDGRHVIYGSTEGAANVLMQVPYPPSNPPTQLHKFDSLACFLDDFSPNGDYFLYHINGKPEIWAFPLEGDREPILAASSLSGQLDQSQFSPDGCWIAYNTDESGRNEVEVVPFPRTGEEWPISKGGGMQPTWRGDGRELYFLSPDGWLMAVAIRASESFEYGEPKRLFKTQVSPNSGMEQYAPDPKGEKFLFVKPTADSAAAPFTVILNWTELLKQ